MHSLIVLENQKTYENRYCTCAASREYPLWCRKWSATYNKSYCILNGGLKSKYCPGARRFQIDGRIVDNYFSSHPAVCRKSERKFKEFDIWHNCTLAHIALILAHDFYIHSGILSDCSGKLDRAFNSINCSLFCLQST